jgi:hypothetical protein
LTIVNSISFSNDGHRAAYDQVLAAALDPHGITIRSHAGRVTTDFFPMLDDNIPSFVSRAILNIAFGKSTVGLFFRPMECFLKTRAKYRLKRLLFQTLRRLPYIRIITILPFAVDDRFHTIADDWIYDPQFWDLEYQPEEIRSGNISQLSETIRRSAGQRKILIALGSQYRLKGFDFFSRIWSEQPEIRKHYLFVAAGSVAEECKKSAHRFAEAEGLLIDRYISDEEMFELYNIADAVWSCYPPDYNQSSGIFGRAFQFAKPSVVREDALLLRLAKALQHPSLSLPFGDTQTASLRLTTWIPERADPVSIKLKIEQMRKRDLDTLANALRFERSAAR